MERTCKIHQQVIVQVQKREFYRTIDACLQTQKDTDVLIDDASSKIDSEMTFHWIWLLLVRFHFSCDFVTFITHDINLLM